MKTKKKTIYWLIVIGVVGFTVWAYLHKSGGQPKPAKVVPVEVDAVSTDSIEKTIEATGWVEANSVITIKSKVPGRIESLKLAADENNYVPVEEGVEVRKGMRICEIDHDVYLAQVAAAGAALKAREVELSDAEREKTRMVRLYEGGSGTAQNRDKAVMAADLAQANLASAKANMELAEINLCESGIASPIDGVVTAKYIDEGNLINSGDRIIGIADVRKVKVIAALAEKYASEVKVGMPVRISVDAFADKQFETTIYSVYPTLDEKTRTIQIEIRLKNEPVILKPGMFARVTLIAARKDGVVVIPRDVVLGGKIDEPYVYIVEGRTTQKRVVKQGIVQADRMEIVEGLKVGEKLVINGMHYLKDGIDVEVVRLEDIK